MLQMTARGRLLASTVMASEMALAIVGVSAAQTISTAEPSQVSPAPAFGPVTANTTPLHDATRAASTQVQEVVVTGSRIPQPNLTSISPVVTVGSQEAKFEGTTRVEDLVNSLPQASAAQTSSTGVGATGTATLNLRNLGADRTLVLIDGKRLGPGDPQNTMGYAADVNLIPAPLISRVEVLTGGASATYGSDAVAGVVNFIVQKDFQGVRLDVTGGGAISDNDNRSLQSIVSSRGIDYPTGTRLDAGTVDVTALLGASAPDGKGNITAYAGYRHQAAVVQSDRDYGACSLGDAATQLVCSGSGITNPAHILAFNPTTSNQIGPEYILSGAGGVASYDGATESFNTAPFKNFQRPDERYTGGFFGHYDVGSGIELYSSFMFMDDQTSFEQAPSGLFGQTFNIPCNSPLFSAAEVGAFCTVGGLGPADSTQLAILRRNVEGGPRELDLRHTDYRINIGARGDLGQNWHYDAYLQYYDAGYSQALFGEFSLAKAANAFNVVQDPDGTLSCATGAAAGCVPYNIFTAGGVTQATLNYLTTPGFQQGSTTEQIASASVTGDFGSYGVRSPYASNGVGVAFGTEYRREALNRTSDNEFLTGDLSGSGGQVLDVQGSEDLYEFFTELRAPLAQDLPFVKSLTANAGYRFSDYSTGFDTNTFKVGGDYAVTSDVLMRGGYNHAIRAPNLLELASPQVVGVDGSIDPCANDLATGLPDATLAQCERTGITPSQYGHISASSSAEYNGLTGGNPDLKPEVANTVTAGVVLTPRKIPRLSISADYYNIKVKDVIGQIGANNIIDACINSNTFCSEIHRSLNGSLYLGNSGFVVDTDLNSGYLQTKGIDLSASYDLAIPPIHDRELGRISFNLDGTYLSTFTSQPVTGGAVYNCAGRYGPVCGQPLPRWRHEVRVTYTPPVPLQISTRWRYFSPVNVDSESTNSFLAGTVYPADSRIGAYSYIDLTLLYRLMGRLDLRAGVNNALGVQPPTIGSSVGGGTTAYNGNTYPGFYDALGRQIFIGVTAEFK